MRNAISGIVFTFLAGLVLTAGFFVQPARADDPASAPVAKGTVSGTVTKDGKPVAAAMVRLTKDRTTGGVNPTPATQPADVPAGNGGGKATKSGGTRGGAPIASGTTDDQGKFTLTDVPVGDYLVRAALKGSGNGQATVTVTADQTATVEITMMAKGKKN